MASHHFKPVGDRARWRVLYDLLRPMAPGDLLTYQQACDALNLQEPQDRQIVRVAIRRAADELLDKEGRAIVSDRGHGYRIARAEQHTELAKQHQRRARAEVDIARAHVEKVDYNQLSEEGKRLARATAGALAMQSEYMRRLDVRQGNLEKVLGQVSVRTERTEREVDDLKESVRALERRLEGERRLPYGSGGPQAG